MALLLSVSLWATEGNDEALAEYEDTVLALIANHGGTVVSRVRRLGGSDPDGIQPLEVQLIELPDEAALTDYLDDPARIALADVHRRVVGRTDLIRVSRIT